ncbi:MAG: hemolysin activation/secretion protein [Planctomycetota bacterium]|jgi:hemolysin activation/secretion protein
MFVTVWILPIGVGAQETLEDIRFTVDKYEIIGENPIGQSAYTVLLPYVGEQYGLEGLSAAADALGQEIIKSGFSFHRVILPPQDLISGTIQFKIVRFAIGAIEVEGNQFFDADNIKNSLPALKVGQTPNTREMSRALKIANQHASKKTVLRFKEGKESDTIDAILAVTDRNPQVFFATLDNTGSKQSEVYRTTIGYQNGNLFNKDHAITATLTTAPEDPDSTTQIGLNYHLPLYAHGASVDILFSDSESNSAGTAGSSIDAIDGISITGVAGAGQGLAITGQGTVIGAIYTRPILTEGNYNHQWSIGFQHKSFNNSSDFNILDYKVTSLPLDLGYSYSKRSPKSSFSGGVNLILEIGDDDADYDADRPGAESGWTAIRFNVSYDYLISQAWLLHTGLSGQNTSNLLISGEQYGVGGVSSLRGFEERSVTGDSGYQLTLELWMPPWEAYGLRFSVFVDMASTEFNDGGTAETAGNSFDLSSAGFGMFWSWKESLSLALNYGVIGKGGGLDTSINQDGDDKLHMNLVYRF